MKWSKTGRFWQTYACLQNSKLGNAEQRVAKHPLRIVHFDFMVILRYYKQTSCFSFKLITNKLDLTSYFKSKLLTLLINKVLAAYGGLPNTSQFTPLPKSHNTSHCNANSYSHSDKAHLHSPSNPSKMLIWHYFEKSAIWLIAMKHWWHIKGI